MPGIDVSKETLSACLLDTHTRRPVWEGEVANTLEGVAHLLQRTPPRPPGS